MDGNLSAYIDDVVAQEGKIISGRVFVDTQKFAYLDMLHESRHIGQLMRLAKQGLSSYTKGQFNIAGYSKTRGIFQWLERGAWEYEMKLGRHFGFSAEYMQFAWNQAYKAYWHHGFVTEFNQPKGSMGKYLRSIWR